SDLINKGHPVTLIQFYVGHKPPGVTAGIYAKANETGLRSIAEAIRYPAKIEAAFKGALGIKETTPESPMYKVLAGDLSATFNLDGGHLQRMLERGPEVVSSLCEQIMLHDQILIPSNDYLTASALLVLIGERNVLDLLENNELRFIRIRKVFG